MKTLALILGMHRSGTSLLSRSLKVFGAEHGDSLLKENMPDNAKGHWEDRDALALNTEMLKFIGKDWNRVDPVTTEEVERLKQHGYFLKIENFLSNRMKNIDFFALKEPRITFLLPAWKAVLDQLSIEKKYFFAFRNPLHVAQSLQVRNAMSLEQGLLLWFSYTYFPLRCLADEDCFFIDYDSMVDVPDSCLQRIGVFLGKKILPQEKEAFLKSFVDKNLRHSTKNIGNEIDCNMFLHSCEFFFKALKNNCRIQQPQLFADNTLVMNFINELGKQHQSLLDTVYTLNTENAGLQNSLTSIYTSRSWRVAQLIKKITLLPNIFLSKRY